MTWRIPASKPGMTEQRPPGLDSDRLSRAGCRLRSAPRRSSALRYAVGADQRVHGHRLPHRACVSAWRCPSTVNMPVQTRSRVSTSRAQDGSGDIAAVLASNQWRAVLGYAVLWPHASPWRFRVPSRCGQRSPIRRRRRRSSLARSPGTRSPPWRLKPPRHPICAARPRRLIPEGAMSEIFAGSSFPKHAVHAGAALVGLAMLFAGLSRVTDFGATRMLRVSADSRTGQLAVSGRSCGRHQCGDGEGRRHCAFRGRGGRLSAWRDARFRAGAPRARTGFAARIRSGRGTPTAADPRGSPERTHHRAEFFGGFPTRACSQTSFQQRGT